MSPAPLDLDDRASGPGGLRPGTPGQPRTRKGAPTQKRIARRHWRVTLAKRILPLVALALLTLIAIWPEISRDLNTTRFAIGRGTVDPESGKLSQARYNGVDEQERPYTVTADFARQTTPDRVDLTNPVGDMTLANGTWLRGEGRQGVYMQQEGQLDLSGNVILYRDDGITLQTDAATLDVKSGSASTASMVHVEGPFGTLDAQGFTVLDHGSVVQFTGPGRLLLNSQNK